MRECKETNQSRDHSQDDECKQSKFDPLIVVEMPSLHADLGSDHPHCYEYSQITEEEILTSQCMQKSKSCNLKMGKINPQRLTKHHDVETNASGS